MTSLPAFNLYANTLRSPIRDELTGLFLKGIRTELRHIKAQFKDNHIPLSAAIIWLKCGTLSDKQIKQRNRYFLKHFVPKHAYFRAGTHYATRKETVYLTETGFNLWVMSQSSPKAQLVKAYNASVLTSDVAGSPPGQNKKSKRSLDQTPVKLDFGSPVRALKKVKHPVLDEIEEKFKGYKAGLRLVYFICEVVDGVVCPNGAFKIGLTTRPVKSRLAEHQCSCVRDLVVYRSIVVDDPRTTEKFMHEMFSEYKIRGEWYELTPSKVDDLVDFIES